MFETICAFLNTKGGYVLLGVDDSGAVIGIDSKYISRLKRDIANLANIIAHREYLSSAPTFINIFSDKIEFTNPNNPRVFGRINPKQFTPYAKNPSISKLMLQMGRVEEVGSGIRNLDKYLHLFSKGATYEFIDEEFFSTIIYLGEKNKEEIKIIKLKTTRKILEIIKENPQVSRKELTLLIGGITEDGVKYHLNRLKEQGVLKRIGPDKGGYWKITEDKLFQLLNNNLNSTTQKTTQKILEIIGDNPRVSRKELALLIGGITEDGIKYHLNRLKEQGILKRIGPDKGGYWKIVKSDIGN